MGKRKKKRFLTLNRLKRPRSFLHSGKSESYKSPKLKGNCTPSRLLQSTKRPFSPRSSEKSSRKRLHFTRSPQNIKSPVVETLLLDDVEVNEDEELSPEQQAFIESATDTKVIEQLAKARVLFYFTSFFQLVKQNKYPLSNISLLLWLETVKWYQLLSVQKMWFWETTRTFWRAGYRLFHGKFLTFMAGPRSIGTIVSGESKRGFISPESSEINFAVPSRTSLVSEFSNVPSVLRPGVIQQTLQAVSMTDNSTINMMCLDGKKVTVGLDKDFGDVDVFGYEGPPKLGDKNIRLCNEIGLINDVRASVSDYSKDQALQENNDPTEQGKQVVEMLRAVIYFLTCRLKESKGLKQRQEYGLQKLKQRAGPDWKTSKYVFAISGIQAFLYRVKQFIDSTLSNIDKLSHLGSTLNGSERFFCNRCELDPAVQQNMFFLKSVEEQIQPVPTALVKQRSDTWHKIRDTAPVTGSTVHNALGLRSLKEQKQHFDSHVLGQKQPDHSNEVKKYLDHGIQNEPNAIATLVGKFLPLFYPDLCYVEEGCYLIDGVSKSPLFVVSPDGSLRKLMTEPNGGSETLFQTCISAIEIKCPFPKENEAHLYYSVPKYYICQCLAEMKSLQVDTLLFVCYTEKSSTFFEMDFDEPLWDMITQTTENLYGKEDVARPKKLNPITRDLKEKLDEFSQKKIRLLAEMPSVKISKEEAAHSSSATPYYRTYTKEVDQQHIIEALSDLQVALNESEDCLQTGHQLSRRKANEVMVWVVSNKDRHWSPELPNSVPIAFAMKDYKLSADALRQATHHILAECSKSGLRIPLLAFDGQWHALMVRDADGNPLTKLQLQKDVWRDVIKMKKSNIVEALKELNHVEINIENPACSSGVIIQKTSEALVVSSSGHAFATVKTNTNPKYWRPKAKESANTQVEEEEDSTNGSDVTLDWIPDNVLDVLESNADGELWNTIHSITKDISKFLSKDRLEKNDDVPLSDVNIFEENAQDKTDTTEVQNEHSGTPPTIDLEKNSEEDKDEMEIEIIADSEPSSFIIETEDSLIPRDVSVDDSLLIISKLKLQKGKRSKKWQSLTLEKFQDSLKSAKSLDCYTKMELDIIASVLKEIFPELDYNFKALKSVKINALSKVIGDGSEVQPRKRKRSLRVPSLQCLADKILRSKKVPKTVLNIAYAQYLFPDRLKVWQRESPVCSKIHVNGEEKELDWYSHPELNRATGELLCKCLDSHHLLTNLRVKTSTSGIEDVSPSAWKRVARSYKTKLTPAIVDDLVDKQSNAYAQTHFSEEVERELTNNGDLNEAYFCKLIRRWYEAEDHPSIAANERVLRWLDLRNYLIKDVNFEIFPPATQYIKGLSVIAFEGFLTGIDTKIQLYGLCDTYCVRTASSLPAETCVGGIQDMNLNNTMAVKAKDIPKIMASLTEVMSYKCDPNRGFYMKTSRSSVYPVVVGDSGISIETQPVPGKVLSIEKIVPKDHAFDKASRRRTKARRKLGTISGDLDAPLKGTQPLRREFHKCDESKILATKRTGLFMEDS